MKKYIVTLTEEECQHLQQLLAKPQLAARTRKHAQALLKADTRAGWTDAEIVEAFDLSIRTVERLRQRFVEQGLEAALKPKSVPRLPRKVDGTVEAHLVALACSAPPEGQQRWTLRLLADKLVELELVESFSHEGVRQVLKKTNSSPGRRKAGGSPRAAAGNSSARWKTS